MPDTARLTTQKLEDFFRRFSELAREKTPFFADAWQRQEKEFGPEWALEVADSLYRLLGEEKGPNWEDALFGYAEFAMDAVRHQTKFEASRIYETNSFDGLAENYYGDDNFMMSTYLPGLFLSHYLWRHHYKLLLFFRNEVLPALGGARQFYEVGVGTGLYSCETLKTLPLVRGTGIDLSESSVKFTKRLIELNGFSQRYACEKMDAFHSSLKKGAADFIVCQELLEHLEDPAKLCRVLRELVKPGGKAYITAAINAAHTDHIYLFRSAEEVKKMLEESGWKIIQYRSELAYDGKAKEVTPCVAGFFCHV